MEYNTVFPDFHTYASTLTTITVPRVEFTVYVRTVRVLYFFDFYFIFIFYPPADG